MTKEDVKLFSGKLKWFKEWHGNNKPESILTTFITGVFKVSEKEARKILKEAVKLKLVTIVDGIATII
ncbi:MAG: hypothetical protein IJ607_10685 [Bacteroidaceae bacterium]|nr:hypothetical protein [Bacteroidaceae bacterium]